VIARAIAKAAAAAAPPISIVRKALRSGAASVKCALTHPKSPSATTVTTTDAINATGDARERHVGGERDEAAGDVRATDLRLYKLAQNATQGPGSPR